jgi:hypothetical protein
VRKSRIPYLPAAPVGAADFVGIVWRFGRGIVGCDHVHVTSVEEVAMRTTFLPGRWKSAIFQRWLAGRAEVPKLIARLQGTGLLNWGSASLHREGKVLTRQDLGGCLPVQHLLATWKLSSPHCNFPQNPHIGCKSSISTTMAYSRILTYVHCLGVLAASFDVNDVY